MPRKIPLVDRTVSAGLTLERLLPRMLQHVRHEIRRIRRPVVAQCAFVPLFAGVRHFVGLECSRGGEAVDAFATLEGLLLAMDLHMVLQFAQII